MEMSGWFGLLTSIVALYLVAAAEESTESTEESQRQLFNQTVHKHPLSLVEFSRAGSEINTTETENAAETLSLLMPSMKVDCASIPSLQVQYNVTSFPTIMLFSHGQHLKYSGAMNAKDIVMFGISAYQSIRSQIKAEEEQSATPGKPPPVRSLSTVAQALRFIDINDVAIIAFLDEKNEEALGVIRELSAQIANKRADLGIAVSTASSVQAAFQAKTLPKLVMFKTGEKTVTYSGDLQYKKLIAWISLHGSIQVQELDVQKVQAVSSSETPIVFFFYSASSNAASAKDMLLQLAPEFTDVLQFYVVDINNFRGLAKQVGIFSDIDKKVVIVFPPKGHHFTMPGEEKPNVDSMRNFFNDYLADKVPRTLRSGPPTKVCEPGAVQSLVTTTFKEVVEDTNADVLVELCKPDVTECGAIGVMLDQLAKAAEGISTFKIARADVAANEISAFLEVSHVPQVLFFPANNKTGLPYDGIATVAKIADFVSEHASFPFQVSADTLSKYSPPPPPPQPTLDNVETDAAAFVAHTLHLTQS